MACLWRKLRAQDELAVETAGLDTAVCLGDPIEGDPLGNAWPDGASCQQSEQPLQILPEPGRVLCPHQVDRIEAGAFSAGQPSPEIEAPDPHQHGRHSALRLDAGRIMSATRSPRSKPVTPSPS